MLTRARATLPPGSSVQGVSRPLSTGWTPYTLSGVWQGRETFSPGAPGSHQGLEQDHRKAQGLSWRKTLGALGLEQFFYSKTAGV